MPCIIHSVFYSLFLRYFALGLLYHYNDQDSAALQVCTAEKSQLMVIAEESAQDSVLEFNKFSLLFFIYIHSFGHGWWMGICRTPQDPTFMSTLLTSCAPAPIWT